MKAVLFPVFPEVPKFINSKIAVKTIDESIFYFNWEMAIYHHHKNDCRSFRYITSQTIDIGNATQMEIARTFGVSKESVKRWVKICRKRGGNDF